MEGLQQFLPLIIMFVIFYFLLIRPQQKRQKQRNAMLASIKKGDKVVTIGGVHGTIQDISDDTVTLRIAHNVHVTFDRGAVNNVVSSSNELGLPSPRKRRKSRKHRWQRKKRVLQVRTRRGAALFFAPSFACKPFYRFEVELTPMIPPKDASRKAPIR